MLLEIYIILFIVALILMFLSLRRLGRGLLWSVVSFLLFIILQLNSYVIEIYTDGQRFVHSDPIAAQVALAFAIISGFISLLHLIVILRSLGSEYQFGGGLS